MKRELGRVHSLKAVTRLSPCWLKPLDKPLLNAREARIAKLDGGQWVVWWSASKANVFQDGNALLREWDIWV